MPLILPRKSTGGLDVSEVFSTDLYTGTSPSGQTITNGLDLSTEGGLVWIKSTNTAAQHVLFDTERSTNAWLETNSTVNEQTHSSVSGLTYNTNGFSIIANTDNLFAHHNSSGKNYVGWSFRQTPGFFDIITYTGDGVAGRQISHSLDATPGMIVVKKYIGSSANWRVWHRSTGDDSTLTLNTTAATVSTDAYVRTADNSTFTVGSSGDVNALGNSYIAYIFAHDDTSKSIIKCGSYAGNGSTTGPIVNLGWDPQYLVVKNISVTGSWLIFDSARGIQSPGNDSRLLVESSTSVAATTDWLDLTGTGFQLKSNSSHINQNTSTYIYIAIRAEGA